MYEVITVSCASPQRMGSSFDIRECVFTVSRGHCFDGTCYQVSCRLPLCEEGLADELVPCDGEFKCRDMKEELRPFLSGKEVGKWYLEDDAQKRYEELLHKSSLPLAFDPPGATTKYDNIVALDWFRVTITVPYFMDRENSTAWRGNYEWHGRLTGKWKSLQDLVDLVIESYRIHDYELRKKEKFYESFINETIEKHGRSLKCRRKQLLLKGLVIVVSVLVSAVAFLYWVKS